MIQNGRQEKPNINYPCDWEYTVIGQSKTLLDQAIRLAMDGRSHLIKLSNTSKGGKYISLKVSVYVASEDVRNLIFRALSNHDAVKVVI